MGFRINEKAKEKIKNIWKNSQYDKIYFYERYITIHNGISEFSSTGDIEINIFENLSVQVVVNTDKYEEYDEPVVLKHEYDEIKRLYQTLELLKNS